MNADFTISTRISVSSLPLIPRQRHDHVGVAVVGGADRRALRVAQLQQQRGFRIEHAEEIVQVAGIERDDDLGAFIGDRQLDVRFAVLGPVGGKTTLPWQR